MKKVFNKLTKMLAIKQVVFLVAVALAQGEHYDHDQHEKIDLVSFTNFVRCVRQQMVRGNPAADLVTFSPYQQPFNYEFPWNLGPHLRTDFKVLYINWTGIPDFSYKFREVPNYNVHDSTFEYIIFWKRLSAKGTWVSDRDFYGCKSHNSGLVEIDLYNREWRGTITLNRREVTDFTVKSKVEKTRVDFTNMGKQEKYIALFSGEMWYYLLNHYPLYAQFLGKYHKDKFTAEWLHRPERINTIFRDCKKY